jgi:hypothetical protein
LRAAFPRPFRRAIRKSCRSQPNGKQTENGENSGSAGLSDEAFLVIRLRAQLWAKSEASPYQMIGVANAGLWVRLGGSLALPNDAAVANRLASDHTVYLFGLGGMENARLSTVSAASLTASLIVGCA